MELTLNIPEDAWQDATDPEYEPARCRLIGPVVWINGTGHHLEAIAVVYDEEAFEQNPLHDGDDERLTNVYLAGGADTPYETTRIGERDYVVYLTPFA